MYKLPTKEQLINAGAPYGMTEQGTPFGPENTEWLRTEPDAVICIPNAPEEYGNEQVHVAEVPGRDCLFALWKRDRVEGAANQSIVYSRSKDGQIWEPARMLVGVRPGMEGKDCMATLPVMTIAPSGRIYVFYTRHMEPLKENPPYAYMLGYWGCMYSDDCGDTWSEPVNINRRVTHWDPPGREEPQIMIPIQSPVHLKDGRCMINYGKVLDESVFERTILGTHVLCREMRTYFAIIENFAESPKPEDFKITWLPDDEEGLCLKGFEMPLDTVEEPFVVELPNGWLFASLRTFQNCIYYSVSEDMGHTWREPKPMCFANGDRFVNPVATPFLCDCGDGRYMQLYHGRCGDNYDQMFDFRDKVYRTYGTFAPEDEQPIRFEEKGDLYLSVDVAAGFRKHVTPEVNIQGSYTNFHGVPMFWYGDRKHYILGKRV